MRITWTLLLLLSLSLAGCSNVDLSDVSTGAGATGAAVAASVVTANPAIIAGVTLTGATVGAALVEDDKSLTTEQIKEVDNPWQALLVAFDQLNNNSNVHVILISFPHPSSY